MKVISQMLLLFVFSIGLLLVVSGQQTDIPAPAGSVDFGGSLYSLPNGNFIVVDMDFSPSGSPVDIGAVHLYDGTSLALISTMQGSSADDRVGENVIVLSNGNFVIASYRWDDGANTDAGAVTFCNGTTGCSGVVSEANSLIGSSTNDRVGFKMVALPGGNYVVNTETWDDGGRVDAGAATFCFGTSGCAGRVNGSNSLIGSKANDDVGSRITVLTDGDYVVSSALFDNGTAENAGHITWCGGNTGCAGLIDSVNSLVGTNTQDALEAVTPLTSGNYAVVALNWNSPTVSSAGAVRFCLGATGCVGEIDTTNSLHGAVFGDRVGSGGVTQLTNGNVVINSRNADIAGVQESGAVTFCDNLSTCLGTVTAANSVYGTSLSDGVGTSGVLRLANGNYVVQSGFWDNGAVANAGASTFCSGTTGCVGPVTTANSLHGTTAEDRVGRKGLQLPSGNYAVISEAWNGAATNGGAVTFCSGTTGCSGAVTAANSLVGSNQDDMVGGMTNIILTNGNFVIRTEDWGTTNLGAVTFCSGTTGCPLGPISAANSLVGSISGDRVGSEFAAALDNGNYLVSSPDWDRPAPLLDPVGAGPAINAGAATLCSGTAGCTGIVSDTNSLVGSNDNDKVGSSAGLLSGKYLVGAELYDTNSSVDAGAVKFCDSIVGCTGAIDSTADFLFGTSATDLVGSGGITVLENGDYVVVSPSFGPPPPVSKAVKSNIPLGGGPTIRQGAVTFGDGARGTFGPITSENSVIGTNGNGGDGLTFEYDPVGDRLIVGRPDDGLVTIFKRAPAARAPFDFDGDGRTDIGIFRPAPAEWWYLRSSDGGNNAFQFGATTDTLVPADFTGDGKTDIAFWRNGQWFVLRSEDSSFFAFPFGTTGDIPAPGDFDGDGKADPAVFRPGTATWFILNSGGGTTIEQFGTAGDRPIVEDYDGDGKDDIAVFRPSVAEWFLNRSADGFIGFSFGAAGDTTPVVGDYTGDGKADIAFFRPTTSEWFVLRSEDSSFFAFPFGATGDQPVAGDYDGDGTADPSVFRPSNSTWFLLQSTSGFTAVQFGITDDIPIPSAYIP